MRIFSTYDMWNRILNYLAKYIVFWELRTMITFYNKVKKIKYTSVPFLKITYYLLILRLRFNSQSSNNYQPSKNPERTKISTSIINFIRLKILCFALDIEPLPDHFLWPWELHQTTNKESAWQLPIIKKREKGIQKQIHYINFFSPRREYLL